MLYVLCETQDTDTDAATDTDSRFDLWKTVSGALLKLSRNLNINTKIFGHDNLSRFPILEIFHKRSLRKESEPLKSVFFEGAICPSQKNTPNFRF